MLTNVVHGSPAKGIMSHDTPNKLETPVEKDHVGRLDGTVVPRGMDWGERESLYEVIGYCHHDSGLCACDNPVVRPAETTKEAWELMYFNKHGKWSDLERQSWLAKLAAPAYSPSDYSPWSDEEAAVPMLQAPLLERQTASTHEYVERKNLCVECGVDMGDCNPRQLCGKTYCEYGI